MILRGLDLEACNKLFVEGKPIRFYPPEKLHNGGYLLDRETRREQAPYVQQTLLWRNVGGRILEDWLPGTR